MNSEENEINEEINSEDEIDQQDESQKKVLFKFEILDRKYFSTYMCFLEKFSVDAYFQFKSSGIEMIHAKEENGEIECVSIATIPEWKMFHYEFNSELINSGDSKSSSFVVEFDPKRIVEILKNFRATDVLVIYYYLGDEEMIILNDSTKGSNPVPVKAHRRRKIINPIEDPISKRTTRPFIKIKSNQFTEIVSKMTRTKDLLSYPMFFKIQDYEDCKGMKICSNMKGHEFLFNYNKKRQNSNVFKIKSTTMKILSLFCKGHEKLFIEVRYTENIIRLTVELGYILCDFYYIKN